MKAGGRAFFYLEMKYLSEKLLVKTEWKLSRCQKKKQPHVFYKKHFYKKMNLKNSKILRKY